MCLHLLPHPMQEASIGLPKAPWVGLCAKVLQGLGKERDTVNRGGRRGRTWGEWVLPGDGTEMGEGWQGLVPCRPTVLVSGGRCQGHSEPFQGRLSKEQGQIPGLNPSMAEQRRDRRDSEQMEQGPASISGFLSHGGPGVLRWGPAREVAKVKFPASQLDKSGSQK